MSAALGLGRIPFPSLHGQSRPSRPLINSLFSLVALGRSQGTRVYGPAQPR